MPIISAVHNPLHHAVAYNPINLVNSTRAQVEFLPGELSPKEQDHARLTARCSFNELLQYAHVMNEDKVTYTEAVRKELMSL
jgi:hypothetical protein